jgi:hypothetical protein
MPLPPPQKKNWTTLLEIKIVLIMSGGGGGDSLFWGVGQKQSILISKSTPRQSGTRLTVAVKGCGGGVAFSMCHRENLPKLGSTHNGMVFWT